MCHTINEVSFEHSHIEESHNHQTACAGVPHELNIGVGNATEHTLDGLEKDSVYTITTSTSASSQEDVITTQQAGNISIHKVV